MLTRLRFRRDFRLFARYLSESSDGNEKPPQNKAKVENQTDKDTQNTNKNEATEKIQALLKAMLTAKPVISEEEYRQKFTVAPERQRRQSSDEIEVNVEEIEESITKAAGDVAQAIGGDVKQTEAELLSRVLGKINQTSTSLSDLLVGMKVDRSTEKDPLEKQVPSRGQQVKKLVDRTRREAQNTTRFAKRKAEESRMQPKSDRMRQSVPHITTVDLFAAEPLGIFTKKGMNYGTKLDVWESLKDRELALATAQPPANYFQKMIQWTEQGKVWKFPIDNEQGLEEEQKIHFSEHVFIEQHLEDWCPTKGPIRHFMELVCVGLSKNAFYTVEEKKDHIMWYREYFESKKNVLTEVGAWDVSKPGNEAST